MNIWEQQRKKREAARESASQAIVAERAGREVVKRLSQVRFTPGGEELLELLRLRIDRWQVMLMNLEADDVAKIASAQSYIKAYGDILNLLTQEVEDETQTN